MSDPARYNIIWSSPSKDYSGSMPLGNGDIALNAWVENSGNLFFYIGKTDSWGDNGRLLKVGRVRIALDPAPPTASFEQTLDLADATMKVHYDDAVTLRLWVDANHPAIHIEIDSTSPITATAAIELWRTEPVTLTELEVSDIMLDRSQPNNQRESVIVEPDTLLTNQMGRIGWYHHNIKSVGPALTSRLQGLDGFERPDPLLHRTFGAVIYTENGERMDDQHLESPAGTSHRFSVAVLTQHPAQPEQWLSALDTIINTAEQVPFDQRREAHQRWWHEFWSRSWINIAGDDDAFMISQYYALQRYINACAGRGAFPIKFNGTLFTVPYPGKPGDADYRRWGPGYWWQNTRLPYISMPTSGDFDLMQPFFRMYGQDLMPLGRYRTRHYLNHDGVYIPECIYFWGDVFTETYGWTPFEERDDKLQESGWHKWEWVSGLELVFFMLDYYEHTLDETFLRETLLPTAHEILTFFDQHYDTGDDGKLVMYPSQSLETWWECTNPMPEIAGLYATIDRLLALPNNLSKSEQRAFWKTLKDKLPELPTRVADGKRALAPAATYADKRNVENPELYAVYPFRLFAFDKPDIDLALVALDHRGDRGHFGWRQDDIFMAYLGLTEQARDGLVSRAKDSDLERLGNTGVQNESRFPAFWGPNYDWIPDQDHGGVFLRTLQSMLIQSEGRKVYLFPAWPSDWDVDFKLHAPFQTTIQGRMRGGEVTELHVTPEARRADVTIMLK